jgi:ubiquitin-like domain-containing CTD phosphatase 1
MFALKIHEIVDGSDLESFQTNFGFRLMYNGQVLTSQVEGCPPDAVLCDAKNLIARVQKFANRSVDCVDPDAGKTHVHAMKVVESLLTTTGGIILALAVAALSAMLGAVGVFFYLTGTLPTKDMIKKSSQFDDESSAGGRSSVVSENMEMSLSNASPFDETEED